MRDTRIIGIDGAVSPHRTGYAYGLMTDGKCSLERASTGLSAEGLVEQTREAVAKGVEVLFAIDAPLGWPNSLGPAVTAHAAGGKLKGEATDLFCRASDRFIHRSIRHRPLDVGADKIARTAKVMLDLLSLLRRELESEIPLGWLPGPISETSCIEVYPAATLHAYGLNPKKYKKAKGLQERKRLVQALKSFGDLTRVHSAMVNSDDAFDAAVCVLAASDFLRGDVLRPGAELGKAILKKEGWIWVKTPSTMSSEECEATNVEENHPKEDKGNEDDFRAEKGQH